MSGTDLAYSGTSGRCTKYFFSAKVGLVEKAKGVLLWDIKVPWKDWYRQLTFLKRCYRIITAYKERQRLFSACVSMGTESHKNCKVSAVINQFLAPCFPSYRIGLKNQIIKSVWINESVNINQSIRMNQFYPFEASNFMIIQYLQLTWKEFVIRGKKREICVVA